ncbi:MAG: aldo/keto reductase [Acidimicrobiales bacterium]
MAEEAGMPLVTMAVAWVLAQPAVTSPIIGASRPDQLDASIAALDVTLDDDLIRRIDDLTNQYLASPELR